MSPSDVVLAIGRSAKEAARSNDVGSEFVRSQLMSAFSTARHLSVELSLHESVVGGFAASLATVFRQVPTEAMPPESARAFAEELATARDPATVGSLLCAALQSIRSTDTFEANELRGRIRSMIAELVELEVEAFAAEIEGPASDLPAKSGSASRTATINDSTTYDPAKQRIDLVTRVLQDAGELRGGESVVDLEQIEGGWSRHSYVAQARLESSALRRFVVRVKSPAGFFDTDLRVEYETLCALSECDLPTPRPFGFRDSEDNPFGDSLFVMDYLPGKTLNVWRDRDRAELVAYWESQDHRLARDIVMYLAQIHEIPAESLPPIIPRKTFRDTRDHWSREYEASALCRDPVIEEALAWLRDHEPDSEELGLVHGDYRVGNVLVDRGRVTAILDWELAHVGDVRFDLGYIALGYIAGKHLRPKTRLLGAVAEHEWFFDEYARASGRPIGADDVRPFSLLGLVSLAAMAHVGIRHYVDGRDSDIRRAWARYSLPGLRQEMVALMDW